MDTNVYKGLKLLWLSHATPVIFFAVLLMFPVWWEWFDKDLHFPFLFKPISVIGGMAFVYFAKKTHYMVSLIVGKDGIVIRTLYKTIEMPYDIIDSIECPSPTQSLLKEMTITKDVQGIKYKYRYLGLSRRDMVSLCNVVAEKGVECIGVKDLL